MTDELIERIRRLKGQCGAVILAHNYQLAEVQDIADFTGDSLGLSRQADSVDAKVIVFCGVYFMAETAAILCPEKTVLLPDRNAGCPMADMITADQLRELREAHPRATVVAYVNSSAEVKACSDVCCTSSNAVEVVKSLGRVDEVIFVPDKHLGQYVATHSGVDMILWNGYCPTHVMITEGDIQRARQEHEGAEVMAHPECAEAVRRAADHVLSTGGMLEMVGGRDGGEFIVATEVGMIHALEKQLPGGRFFPANRRAECVNMKRIRLEHVLWTLEDFVGSDGRSERYSVVVDQQVRAGARVAIDRMLDVSPAWVRR